jgi:hypothetical protein
MSAAAAGRAPCPWRGHQLARRGGRRYLACSPLPRRAGEYDPSLWAISDKYRQDLASAAHAGQRRAGVRAAGAWMCGDWEMKWRRHSGGALLHTYGSCRKAGAVGGVLE